MKVASEFSKAARLGLLVAAAHCFVACGSHTPGGMTGPSINNRFTPVARHPLESTEILERPQKTSTASVRHILIGYESLAGNYPGAIDPRAKKRSREEAVDLVSALVKKLKAGTPFIAVLLEHSEDGGSAKTGSAYLVEPAAAFEKDFISLSLRLEVGEFGVVRSSYGFHLIRRAK